MESMAFPEVEIDRTKFKLRAKAAVDGKRQFYSISFVLFIRRT